MSVRSWFERVAGIKELRRDLRVATDSLQVLRQAFSGSAPGAWASDHYKEAQQCSGWVYIAATSLANQVSQCTVKLSEHAAPQVQNLVTKPNFEQSGASFRYMQTLQLALHGACIVWKVKKDGEWRERYVIPTSLLSPTPDGFRIAVNIFANEKWMNVPNILMLGKVTLIPYNECKVYRMPHPWILTDGLSPVSAGSRWIDTANEIDNARYQTMASAVRPGLLIEEAPDSDLDPEDRKRVIEELRGDHGGTNNSGKNMFLPKGLMARPWALTATDLDYAASFNQLRDAILSLYKTPPIACGVTEAGSYTALYAALQQYTELAVAPVANLLAEEDKQSFDSEFVSSDNSLEYIPKKVNDPTLGPTNADIMARTGCFTINEVRDAMGLSPIDNGDTLIQGNSASIVVSGTPQAPRTGLT